jgi:hypothetical protein
MTTETTYFLVNDLTRDHYTVVMRFAGRRAAAAWLQKAVKPRSKVGFDLEVIEASVTEDLDLEERVSRGHYREVGRELLAEDLTEVVTSVDENGAHTSTGRSVTWVALRAAAGQDDQHLADYYLGLLEEAYDLAASRSPVEVTVLSRTGGATWAVALRAAWGGGPVASPYYALLHVDEGMDHGHRHQAEAEAKRVAERLRGKGRPASVVVMPHP